MSGWRTDVFPRREKKTLLSLESIITYESTFSVAGEGALTSARKMNLHLQGSVYRIYTCRVHVVVVQTEDAVRIARGFPVVCRRPSRTKRAHWKRFRGLFDSNLVCARGTGSHQRLPRGAPSPTGQPVLGATAAMFWPSSSSAAKGTFRYARVPALALGSSPPLGGSRDPSRGSRHPRLFVPLGDFSRDAQARDASRQLASRRDHPAHRPEPSDDARLSPPAQDARRSLTAHFSAHPSIRAVVSV